MTPNDTIHEKLERLSTASVPARHVKSRPVTKNPNGPKHQYIPWDVTAAALNYYLGPANWRTEIKLGAEYNIITATCAVIVVENHETVTVREAGGSAPMTEEDAAGQATAAAFKRAATLLGYNILSKPICDQPCCAP